MKNVDVQHTRNFALIGHSGDGKTTLGEALLFRAGATHAQGKVDDGTSVLNFLPEEKDRHTATISSSVYAFDWDGHHATLVDTPGDPNFNADAQIVLAGLDGAVLLVSPTDGPKVGTEKLLRAARRSDVACLAFVSGMDRERADFDTAVEALRKLESGAIPLCIPIGSADNHSGVIDLMARKAFTADGEGEIPADLADEAEAARQRLVEAVAECDDTLLEKYLEEGDLDEDEVREGLVAGTRRGQILPVLCGSGAAAIGIDPLLKGLTELLPSPADRPPFRAGEDDAELAADPDGPFTARVIKTMIDRYAGTLSIFRVVSGRLLADSSLVNAGTGEKARVGKLLLMRGEQHDDVPEAGPGDIVAVAKLKGVHTGQGLTQEKGGVALPEISIPQGVLSYAISAESKGDEDKVYASLGRLVEEDPTLHLGREASTGEFLLTGMGELHIRTTVHKLKRLFEVDVELKTPKVPYRETITRKAENVEGKLKKQTGGKGMFGVCYLTLEPRGRGEGFEFSDEIVGGAIPRGLIPAVEKGCLEGMERGPLAGYPVVDIRVRCIDGKFHSVDSNEMAFKLAGSFGFKAAMQAARPTILEPIMNVEVTAPDDHIGDVMGDLSSRRGRVQASEASGSAQMIRVQVPMCEMLEYASTLTSLTGGKGDFHMEFSHYDEVPSNVRDKLVAEAKASQAEDS
ncbi:MAG: elongation factor G [Deltaproteobacteria bacterium]|nr:elongation factor G [Deltaproteobacteria bacterium]MBW2372289.1 elongation factor G [Deltaproteobacteria bacterium]